MFLCARQTIASISTRSSRSTSIYVRQFQSTCIKIQSSTSSSSPTSFSLYMSAYRHILFCCLSLFLRHPPPPIPLPPSFVSLSSTRRRLRFISLYNIPPNRSQQTDNAPAELSQSPRIHSAFLRLFLCT